MLRLEGLTLSGFKSFASRTELELPDGITCVVGPNGCGKSNIVDAVTWVLGEQRARLLRGSSMEDVIFAGARTRKPAGLAEVSLAFAPRPEVEGRGRGRSGPTPDDLEAQRGEGGGAEDEAGAQDDAAARAALDEEPDPRLREPLTVTRRLYRNGDSEYLVNGERVRLKDVTRLLTGTGLTTRAYSIIGQGRVEQILASKPTDRRVLIEEAAGITGYRAKRRSAKMKLDQSEQDLLRADDIIAEIEKQLRSLKRQASAARRYRRLAGRQRIVLRALYSVQHLRLGERLRCAEEELAALRRGEEQSARTLQQLEEAAETARERVAATESERDELARREQELQLELERSRSVVESSRERLSDNEEQSRRVAAQRERLDEEHVALAARRDEQREELRRLDEDLEVAQRRLEECAESARDGRARLEGARRLIAETKETVFEVMSEAAGLRNRKQEVEEALGRQRSAAARLAEQLEEQEAEAAALDERLEQGHARLRDAIAAEDAARHEVERVSARLSELAGRSTELAREADEARSELHDAEWQLSAVSESVRSRAAYREGVRRLLDAGPEGARGTVADLVRARPGDELACEKALGPLLQAVVFDSRAQAEAALESVGRDPEVQVVFPDAGAATLAAGGGPAAARMSESAPPTAEPAGDRAAEGAPDGYRVPEARELQAAEVLQDAGSPEPADARAEPRVVGRLAESLHLDASVAWLVGLLPRVLLVDEAATALELGRRDPASTFVSRDGVLVGPGGQGSAGRPLGEGEGILEAKARREDLEARVARLKERSDTFQDELAQVDGERREMSARREELRAELARAEKEALSARHGLEGLRQAGESAAARLSSLRFEHEAARSELDDALQRIERYDERIAGCASRREELDALLRETQELAVGLEESGAEAEAELARVRESVVVGRERREAAGVQLTRLEHEVTRLEERLAQLGAEEADLAAAREQLEATRLEAEEAIRTGTERWQELKTSLEGASGQLARERSELLEGAERLRALRAEHDVAQREAGESAVRRERCASALEHLIEDCRKELGLSPEELEPPTPPAPDDAEDEAEPDASEDLEVASGAAEPEAGRTAAAASLDGGDAAAGEEGASRDADAAGDDDDGDADDGPPERRAEPEVVIDESLPWGEDGELDVEALAAEAEDLRGRISRVGPVNLVAIEEHDELEGRHSFLTTERDDLVASIHDLRATIAQIDKTSREHFLEAFGVVRESFDECFQTLFRGGRAELRLQDEDDPLESGIEIIAQPPGKRLQNMMLLSGGEKALTAIALLFALFRYKPSPVCILDEVDAPLDEANVGRFIGLVRDMSNETQVILVTHNRRSMEQGNVLYGVTMEEQGCSKLVSVSFEGLPESDAA